MNPALHPDVASIEQQLTAALHLISSSALRGRSEVKTRALLGHLHHLAAHPDLPPVLSQTVTELIQLWSATRPCAAHHAAPLGPALRSTLH